MQQLADQVVDSVYRSDWGRIVAALIRAFGDFDLAEEVAQEAFAAAIDQWRNSEIPDSPAAWIIQAAKFKAIDRIRRKTKFSEIEIPWLSETTNPNYDTEEIPDDRLRLIFTCCHPALAPESQVALTLRTLCGLETDEIARAFLVPTATMAQRLVRAKRKIRDAKIPYSIPNLADMPERLDSVLTTIYLVFNEGYAATRGDQLVRTDLCAEAIRLARLVRTLMGPGAPSEVSGLLALLLLHDARREARLDAAGDIVTLEEQDRSLWHRDQIREALGLVEQALDGTPGPLSVQAAIAATHCQAGRAEDTNWKGIRNLYSLLEQLQPSPVVTLNRAVAVAMADGVPPALEIINSLAKDLDEYHLLHSARADLLRRAGEYGAAAVSYRRALELVTNDSERRYLEKRLREVSV